MLIVQIMNYSKILKLLLSTLIIIHFIESYTIFRINNLSKLYFIFK